jgi:hypothetical protein
MYMQVRMTCISLLYRLQETLMEVTAGKHRYLVNLWTVIFSLGAIAPA